MLICETNIVYWPWPLPCCWSKSIHLATVLHSNSCYIVVVSIFLLSAASCRAIRRMVSVRWDFFSVIFANDTPHNYCKSATHSLCGFHSYMYMYSNFRQRYDDTEVWHRSMQIYCLNTTTGFTHLLVGEGSALSVLSFLLITHSLTPTLPPFFLRSSLFSSLVWEDIITLAHGRRVKGYSLHPLLWLKFRTCCN